MPCSRSQARFSPAANSTYASAHCRGQWSSALDRSKPAVPSQSCQASSSESWMPQPALLGGVDEEEPAEGPERLAAEARLGLLLDEHDPAPGVGQLGGGDQPGQPGPDDDDVCLEPFGRLAHDAAPASAACIAAKAWSVRTVRPKSASTGLPASTGR